MEKNTGNLMNNIYQTKKSLLKLAKNQPSKKGTNSGQKVPTALNVSNYWITEFWGSNVDPKIRFKLR